MLFRPGVVGWRFQPLARSLAATGFHWPEYPSSSPRVLLGAEHADRYDDLRSYRVRLTGRWAHVELVHPEQPDAEDWPCSGRMFVIDSGQAASRARPAQEAISAASYIGPRPWGDDAAVLAHHRVLGLAISWSVRVRRPPPPAVVLLPITLYYRQRK